MKNIHLLPTDKPSRLFLNQVNNKLLLEDISNPGLKNVLPSGSYQNIYVTSNEEIKDVDWCYAILSKQVFKNVNPNLKSEDKKKIILTTDQDLINDGVQKIDDEFLEWFVKNPSCEEVEVVDNLKYFNVDELRERHLKGLPHLYSEKIGYKIIIQKEEPKQELPKLGTKEFNDLASAYFGGKPKQETLEETYNKWSLEEAQKFALSKFKYGDHSDKGYITIELILEVLKVGVLTGHKFGAKWQAERMYSEEEVEGIIASLLHTPKLVEEGSWEDIAKWLEQFKKK